MSTTRTAATRTFGVAAFALGLLFARPNLGPTPAVAASVVSAAVVTSVDPARNPQASEEAAQLVPETNPYTDSSQCVYRAWELAAEHGHKMPNLGNAADWKQGAIDAGYTVVEELSPQVVNSVAVWDANVGGTGWAGHVGWVTEVRGDEFHVLERNWTPAADSDRWVKWEPGISFIIFSDPTPPPPVTAGENQPVALRPLGIGRGSSTPATLQTLMRSDELLQAPSLAGLSHSDEANLWPRWLRDAGIQPAPSIEPLLEPSL